MMLKARKLLCACFGFFSLIFAMAAVSIASLLLRSSGSRPAQPAPHISTVVGVALYLLARVFIAAPVLLAFLNGMAWFAIARGKASARAWVLAASTALVLVSIPLCVLAALQYAHSSPGAHASNAIFALILFAVGLLGFVVFARRIETAHSSASAKPVRVAGDGTSTLGDKIAWVVSSIGYFLCQQLWVHWAEHRGLPIPRGVGLWIALVIAILLATAVHELGHAAIGRAVGMKLRAFIVGPFQLRIRDGRWKFQFQPAQLLAAGGAAALAPTDPDQSKWCEIAMIAAGPLASLTVSGLGMAIAVAAPGSPYAPAWEFFAFLATFGLISFVSNLMPVAPNSLYSDGARIYQLLFGGCWTDLRRAFATASSASVTPTRPRDYDIDAIRRASASFALGRHALLLRLQATAHFFDSGSFAQAADELREAESICEASISDVPVELCPAFVFHNAFLRRDAAAARRWWTRMESGKLAYRGVDYWLAKSALMWIEGRLDEACKAWEKGSSIAEKLPTAGVYEYDRYRCFRLGLALQHSLAWSRVNPALGAVAAA